MTEKQMLQIVIRALELACKFIRENPPSYFHIYSEKPHLLNALIDKGEDPDGLLYLEVFVPQAVAELKKEGKI
jgi:hypothetical protein